MMKTSKLSDEEIQHCIDNPSEENAEVLYNHILDFSPYGAELSPEYEDGVIKLFYYEHSRLAIVVATIHCTLDNLKTLINAPVEDIQDIVSRLLYRTQVIDFSPSENVENINNSMVESLTPWEQAQYSMMQGYDDEI